MLISQITNALIYYTMWNIYDIVWAVFTLFTVSFGYFKHSNVCVLTISLKQIRTKNRLCQ